ncbi:MAG: bifunctional aspartate transaminase/aspartate 4-decarboxylase [Pseudomonadota bacterium]
METIDYSNFSKLSPFELKDELIKLAKSHSERMMLNAGRGNPNFLATEPRRAFLRLADFAMLEAERSYAYLESGIGGLPEEDGIDLRFEIFADRQEGAEGISFLRNAIAFVKDRLGQTQEAFLHEMVNAFLGCNYPVPPRMLMHSEEIVKAYIGQEMYNYHPRGGDFSLFATEGGTAAMAYIFQSMKLNGLIKPGDKIALGTPIFSPYLEIPLLPEYQLEIVDIRMDEDSDWQYPDNELAKLEDPEIKIFFMVNPSNPPSVKLSYESLHKIADLVNNKRKDLFIVTDDVYGTFADNFVSLFAVCPHNTLCVYSFSKYFGATGWRLGVIALHDDNVFDEMLKALPSSVKEEQAKRYSSLTNQPEELLFIDRLVADSRVVALNHTAGLSTPQQLQMTLFALNGLMDNHNLYKDSAKNLIRHRYQNLCMYVGIPPVLGPNEVNYYYLIDLQRLGGQIYGEAFAAWMATENRGTEFLFRLANEVSVVLLPGKGFEVVDASVRVSLANLTDAEYSAIGKCTKQILEELFEEFST